jgi:two-component system cell cycle response regulator
MRILIADDDPMSARLLERTLIRQDHEVVLVTDGPSAMKALLAPDGPRMAILDWMMPGADGLTVCRALRQREEHYVYVIILTARGNREDIVMGLDSGADDFLTKPFDPEELRSRLRSGRRVLELQERLLEAQAELRVLATRDELTGLWNRRRVTEQLGGELKRARYDSRPVCVAMVDVDNFKKINDLYGHPVGDVVLREVAARMKGAIRDYDSIGRYGGEEFLVVLPGVDSVDGLIVAERIRLAVGAHPIQTSDGPLEVCVSIGLSFAYPGGMGEDESIRVADEALYRAKSQGRNRVAL